MAEDRAMPNAALRTLFEAIEEVMGANGLKAILRMGNLERFIDNPPANNLEMGVMFSDYGAAEQAVEDFYGPRGARAMLMRIGRATFNYSLKEQPAILGLAGVALKALPMGPRIKLVLDNMAKALTKDVNQPAHIEEYGDNFYLIAEECPCHWRPAHDKPCCFVSIGGIQEALRWATGKSFRVEEVTCLAKGDDACRYQIPKTPIDES